jgi:hypothetical protein
MSGLAVQPCTTRRTRARNDRHAWNGANREGEARNRTEPRKFRSNAPPNPVHVLPIEIDDARGVFAKNFYSGRAVCREVLVVREFEQRQTVVVDRRHCFAPLDGANIFRVASQGSTSFDVVPFAQSCPVNSGTSLHCTGNNRGVASCVENSRKWICGQFPRRKEIAAKIFSGIWPCFYGLTRPLTISPRTPVQASACAAIGSQAVTSQQAARCRQSSPKWRGGSNEFRRRGAPRSGSAWLGFQKDVLLSSPLCASTVVMWGQGRRHAHLFGSAA